MGEKIDAARMKLMQDNTGKCGNAAAGITEYTVSADTPFTYEDIHALARTFFGDSEEALKFVHMSNLPGRICWRNQDPAENRKFAAAVDKRCKTVLSGPGADKKCEELYKSADYYSGNPTPGFFSVAGIKHYASEGLKWAGLAVAGGYAAGLGFSHMGQIFHAQTAATAARAAHVAASVAAAAGEAAVAGGAVTVGGAASGGAAASVGAGGAANGFFPMFMIMTTGIIHMMKEGLGGRSSEYSDSNYML